MCHHTLDEDKELFSYKKINLSKYNFFDIIPGNDKEFFEMYPAEIGKLYDNIEKLSTLSASNHDVLEQMKNSINEDFKYLSKFIPAQSDKYFKSTIYECTCFEQFIILEIIGCLRNKSYPIMCANKNCTKIFFPSNGHSKYCPRCSTRATYDSNNQDKQSWFSKTKTKEYNYYYKHRTKPSLPDGWWHDAGELCQKYEAECVSDMDWKNPADEIQHNFYQEINIISAKHGLPPHKRNKTRKK